MASLLRTAGRLSLRGPAPTQMRMLNLHEYQSTWLMQQHRVKVQKFRVAETPEQAQKYAEELGMFK